MSRPVVATREETLPEAANIRLIWLLTVAAGVTAANLYYSQPLLADIAHTFAISAGQAGLLATLGQLGFGLGLVLIVPLGDSRGRRGLLVTMLLLEAGALLGMAYAPTMGWMGIACFVAGFLTVVPQIVIPFAASLATDERRGRIIGMVLSGILIGILCARTVSGFVGAVLGWRAMYGIAAGLMLLLALVLWRAVPEQSSSGAPYLLLLASLWRIIRTEPALRPVCLFGALSFAAFNVIWVTLSFFLRTPPYHFASDIVGLFGLAGVAGATAAPQVGRLVDRTGRPRITIGLGLSIVLLAFAIFWLLGHVLWGLIIGALLLDLGVQTNLTSCQAIVQNLRPDARSRLNTIFMTCYFIGGAAGSTLGACAWGLAWWAGVCISGVALLLIALGIFVLTGRRAQRA